MAAATVRDAWREPNDDGDSVYRTAIDAPGVYVGLDLGRLSDGADDTVGGLRAALAAAAEHGKAEGIASATDADVALEFFRRFRPIQVHMGAWRGRAAVAELEDDGTWISEALPDGARREEHAAGEDGFVYALDRARQLVRGGR